MSFWKKLFGGSSAAAAQPPTPKPAAPKTPKPAPPPQPTSLIDEAKAIIRKASGARDFLSRATQAGWRKIKEDFIGIYLQKGDATLIFGVLPSHGPDTIWNAMMTTKDTGTVHLITEGRIAVTDTTSPAPSSAAKEQATASETSTESKKFCHRGFLFTTDGEYCPLCDDSRTVYGLWFRDPASIRSQARLKMVVAHLSNSGYKISDDDYYTTIMQGHGGTEQLDASSGGGSVLWFASAKKILGG